MKSNIRKTKILVCISVIALLISNCNRKTDLDNQITITINSVDSDTKRPRVNAFDTIEVRKLGIGYLMKTSKKVGEYVTDSLGSAKIKIDRTEGYHISLYGIAVFGWANFNENDLKDGQDVIIEASPPEKR
jgi:hypothetical protein